MEINFALHVQLYDAILTNQKRRNWSATAGLFRDAGGRVDPESTQEGGGQAVGSVNTTRRFTEGTRKSRKRCCATPRSFIRTKDGSRRCSLSRDLNVGIQENNRTPKFRQKPPWRVLWPHRRTDTMTRVPETFQTGTKNDVRPLTTRHIGRTSQRRARSTKITAVSAPG